MKELLSFDTMVTPKIITVIYWLQLVLMVLFGLTVLMTFKGGFLGVIVGLLFIVLSALFVRVGCELMIVVFKMNEALQEIRQK